MDHEFVFLPELIARHAQKARHRTAQGDGMPALPRSTIGKVLKRDLRDGLLSSKEG